MSSFTRLREESNKIGIDFILTELDTAFTFLDVAATTNSPETCHRNRGHACEAYETALRLQPRVVMDSAQKGEFQSKICVLRKRLMELGFRV